MKVTKIHFVVTGFDFRRWEHNPIAYDSFNIHENDPKIKPDVFVSKQHVLRVSPTTLKNLAGQFLYRIDYHSINFIKQIEIYMNFT